MILVDAGDRTDLSFDLRLEFADTLRRAGLVAGIDDATIPDKLHASQKYRACFGPSVFFGKIAIFKAR